MAFGKRNAPATFQRLLQKVLSGIMNCEAYLDDLVTYSDNWEAHVCSVDQEFSWLAHASLTLNLSKCEFAKALITYLGKQVGQGHVKPVMAKVSAMLDFPIPVNKRDLWRFFGMVGYYHGFCYNFSMVVSPLTDLLSISKKFEWNTRFDHAFTAVKDLLCNAPVLPAPDFTKLFS